MTDIGRSLLIVGLLLAAIGAVILIGGRLGLPHLPGDFVFRRGQTTLFFPLATSILLSLILTIVLNLFLRRRP